MGPIHDSLGLEQGGVNSDRLYTLCNNAQLQNASESSLGIDIDGIVISSIGQADDVVLLANSPLNLVCLLHLTTLYCTRNHVTLVPEKTKLLAWSPARQHQSTNLLKLECPVQMDNMPLEFSPSAEHVGIIRSTEAGNMPHVLERIASYRCSPSS